jgi:hypothetical protein
MWFSMKKFDFASYSVLFLFPCFSTRSRWAWLFWCLLSPEIFVHTTCSKWCVADSRACASLQSSTGFCFHFGYLVSTSPNRRFILCAPRVVLVDFFDPKAAARLGLVRFIFCAQFLRRCRAPGLGFCAQVSSAVFRVAVPSDFVRFFSSCFLFASQGARPFFLLIFIGLQLDPVPHLDFILRWPLPAA